MLTVICDCEKKIALFRQLKELEKSRLGLMIVESIDGRMETQFTNFPSQK